MEETVRRDETSHLASLVASPTRCIRRKRKFEQGLYKGRKIGIFPSPTTEMLYEGEDQEFFEVPGPV